AAAEEQLTRPLPGGTAGPLRARLERLRTEQAALIAESERLARDYEDRQRRLAAGGGTFGERATGGAGEAAARRARAERDIAALQATFDRRLAVEQGYQQQLARIREAEQAGAIDGIEAQRLVAAATRERDEALRRLTSSQRAAIASTRDNRDAERELNEVLRERERLIEQTETAYERYQRRLETLGRLVERAERVGAPVPQETIRREAQAAIDELDRAEERTRETTDTARELGLAFSSAFEDAILRGRSFSDVLKSIEQDLLRLGTRRLVTEPLLSGLDRLLGSGSDGGTLLSRLLGGTLPGGGGLFGGIGSLFTSIFGAIFHRGGMVGDPAPGRSVPALAFAGAPRFHAGGLPGLRPDEVPAILQRGERVLSREEVRRGAGVPRGASAPAQVHVTIVAPSPETFHASRALIEARMAHALRMGSRNL
ncbi:MAG: hypothetical protein SNJ73_09795, partial [Acetobacteraceae bacterium]